MLKIDSYKKTKWREPMNTKLPPQIRRDPLTAILFTSRCSLRRQHQPPMRTTLRHESLNHPPTPFR